jgi:hypothetical protein
VRLEIVAELRQLALQDVGGGQLRGAPGPDPARRRTVGDVGQPLGEPYASTVALGAVAPKWLDRGSGTSAPPACGVLVPISFTV